MRTLTSAKAGERSLRQKLAPRSPLPPVHVPGHEGAHCLWGLGQRAGGTHCEEKPRALHIAKLRELVQQLPLGPHPPCGRPTGCPTRPVVALLASGPAGHVRPQLSNARRAAPPAKLNTRVSPVLQSTTMSHGTSCSLVCCQDVQVIQERQQGIRRMHGGGSLEQGAMLSRSNKDRGLRITLLAPFALRDVAAIGITSPPTVSGWPPISGAMCSFSLCL